MRFLRIFLIIFLFSPSLLLGQVPNPIVFVTQPPKPEDFANIVSTFANHKADPMSAPRGGDLWIRYPDGSLRNLTQEAGYGSAGMQGDNSITVRDPVVHWDGQKVLFSMVVGAPSQYEYPEYRFQLYEAEGILQGQSVTITKVEGQPEEYNNVMPVYTGEDNIIFASDMPRSKEAHLYPQLDEYESTPTNTGLWLLDHEKQSVRILDHSPSGNFHPIADSFGRILFSRWDHLQQDQQAEDDSYGAFTFSDESESATVLNTRKEIFPEPRSEERRERADVSLHTINLFVPWEMNADGTNLETLNHIGRHELGSYFPQSFTSDPNLNEFIGELNPYSDNDYPVANLFQLREDPVNLGTYYGINAPEFYTHSSGQIVSITAPPDLNASRMKVLSITHPATSDATNNNSLAGHSGLYRNPLPLSNGKLVAVHTSEKRIDINEGSRSNPKSRYRYRIKLLKKSGDYFVPDINLTNGIKKNISFYDPDVLVSYSGDMWELQPVEVIARPRPPKISAQLPQIEEGIFNSNGIKLQDFTDYLKSKNLALIVVRDITTRDRADKQQPYNLSVGTSNGDGFYRIDGLHFLQADQVRGYTVINQGRRPIARSLNSVTVPNAMKLANKEGTYKIEQDGSVAALVPAGRALSWELVDHVGEPVVRERIWATFQAGEVRVCASCHGINERDQLGRKPPTNAPLALAKLLALWRDDPELVKVPENSEGSLVKVRVRRIDSVFRNTKGALFRVVVVGLNPDISSYTLQLKNGKGLTFKQEQVAPNTKGRAVNNIKVSKKRYAKKTEAVVLNNGLYLASGSIGRLK